MAQIKLKLEKQLLTIQNQEIIASGDMNYDTCAFTFDGEWNGFVKTAVFYQDKENVQYTVLSSDDTCVIPAAAMAKEGNLYIGVFGISGSKVMTSTVERIYIRQGAIAGDTVSTEPSDDVFLAIIAQYQMIAEKMAAYDVKMDEFIEIMNALNAFEAASVEIRLKKAEDKLATMEESLGETVKEVVAENIGGLRFAQDGEGRWGYIVPDSEIIIPFKNTGGSVEPDDEIKTYQWHTVESTEAFSQDGNVWNGTLEKTHADNNKQHIFLVVSVPRACKTIITLYIHSSKNALYINDEEIQLGETQIGSAFNIRKTIELKQGINYLYLESYNGTVSGPNASYTATTQISFAPIMA